jgi:hypothetical protein
MLVGMIAGSGHFNGGSEAGSPLRSAMKRSSSNTDRIADLFGHNPDINVRVFNAQLDDQG